MTGDDLDAAETAMLASLAEFRLLTVSQLCVLDGRDKRSTRRSIQALREVGLIQIVTQISRGRGRPEQVAAPSSRGIDLLVKRQLLTREQAWDPEAVVKTVPLDHQLLENWARIRLLEMEQATPQISVRYVAAVSPFAFTDGGGKALAPAPQTHGAGTTGLLPDGAFAVTHRERHKSLLFFLEVDMGTEVIDSKRIGALDIRRKIAHYQACFTLKLYKQYEPVFGSTLNGFRVLFLANTPSRLDALCRSVARWPNTDFVWLTEEERLNSQGMGGPIWARGGRRDLPCESILGSAIPKAFQPCPQKREAAPEREREPSA